MKKTILTICICLIVQVVFALDCKRFDESMQKYLDEFPNTISERERIRIAGKLESEIGSNYTASKAGECLAKFAVKKLNLMNDNRKMKVSDFIEKVN